VTTSATGTRTFRRNGEPRSANRPRRRDTATGWSFLVPFLIVYVLFLIYPVIQAVFMGFFKWDLLDISDRSYIGLRNYGKMFWGTEMTWDVMHLLAWRLGGLALIPLIWLGERRDRLTRGFATAATVGLVVFFGLVLGIHPGEGGRWYDSQFWPSFGNTTLFTFMSTPLIVGIGLVLALALNRQGRFVGVLRTVFFAPYVLSVSVLTLIWIFLLSPQLGLIGAAFEWIGLEPVSWLTSTTWAMPAIVVTTLWWTVGFNVVLFLAGLQDIDPHQYEAASIDGANSWGKFRWVTIPGLSRTTVLVVMLQVIASFQIFGQVFIMTKGGPGGSTRVVIQHIFEASFRDFELGYASAMSVFLFVAIVGVSIVQLPFFRSVDA